MSYLRKAIIPGILAVLVLASSAEAMVRKCGRTASGLPIRNTKPLLMIDGELRGDMPAPPATSEPRWFEISTGVPGDEILSLEIACLDIVEGEELVGRFVISIITKGGAERLMRSHLQALAVEQEEYRRRAGTYAVDLPSLKFFASRAWLPVEMQVTDTGWQASVQLPTSATICEMVVEFARTEESPPVALCR